MHRKKWFDRKFDFSAQENILPSIIERLGGSYERLHAELEKVSSSILSLRSDDSWSIKENIGHLCDLEPLWQGRLSDILEIKKYLRSTDLQNRQTDLAQHNKTEVNLLLSSFKNLREATLKRLQQLENEDVYKSALHPRLEQPMRVMDLFLFVAEHDDHHLNRIVDIKMKMTN